jgi:hypothetical protein
MKERVKMKSPQTNEEEGGDDDLNYRKTKVKVKLFKCLTRALYVLN